MYRILYKTIEIGTVERGEQNKFIIEKNITGIKHARREGMSKLYFYKGDFSSFFKTKLERLIKDNVMQSSTDKIMLKKM